MLNDKQERAAFETWAASYSTLPLDRDDSPAFGTTSYQDMGQAMLWEAWQARAALAAVPMQEVPAGFVLVPVEPTAEMLASLTGFDFRGDFDQRRSAMRRGAWAALLSAASRAGVNK